MQWFYNLKISRKLILGFVVIALFAVFLGVLSFYGLYGIHLQFVPFLSFSCIMVGTIGMENP